jgi:hypothetical protein
MSGPSHLEGHIRNTKTRAICTTHPLRLFRVYRDAAILLFIAIFLVQIE